MTSQKKGRKIVWLALAICMAGVQLNGQQTLELDNDTLHLKLDLTRGGAINYISKSGADRNIVNIHDEGRYIQQSYYAGKVLNRQAEGQNPNWSPWAWNPIQVGDSYRNRAEILDSGKIGNTLYVKCIPMLWDMNNEPAEAIMEQWTTLEGNVLRVRNRLTCQRTDDIWGEGISRHQELPAVYPVSALKHLYSYFGDLPFSGGPLSKPEVIHLEDGFWGRYENDMVTENWMAFVDDNHWGIGVYTPICSNFLAGMAGSPGYEAMDGPTSYIAPVKSEALYKNSVFEYEYWLVVGTLQQIRSTIYAIKGVQANAWEFTDDLEGWHEDPRGGTVEQSTGSLVFNVSGEGSGVGKSLDVWKAGQLRYLWLGIKNGTAGDTGALSFYTAADSTSISYPLIPMDTAYRNVIMDMDTISFWNSELILDQLRLHPVTGNYPGNVRVDFIRFLESLVRIRAEGDAEEIKGIGNSLQLYAEEIPAFGALEVDWSVDLPGVASISESGLLTGVSEGIVTVSAVPKNGGGSPGSARFSVTDTAKITAWEFTTDLEGWDKNPNGGTVTWSDGNLKFSVASADPYVYCHVGPWKVGNLKYLWIRVRNETAGNGGAMYLFPTGGGHDFVRIPLTPNDNEFRDIFVDMRNAGIWNPELVLENLRLDPNNGGETGMVSVDFIRFLENPQGVFPEEEGTGKKGVIFPNPADDRLCFDPALDWRSVEVIDLTGKVLRNETNLINRSSINISALAPGVYMLRSVGPGGQTDINRFIKK